MGRSKIEIKEIQNKGAMYCTFTKRRNGLCSKARELHTLCGAQVAAIVFSPKNKMYTFGEPSVDSVVNRFLHEQQQQQQRQRRRRRRRQRPRTKSKTTTTTTGFLGRGSSSYQTSYQYAERAWKARTNGVSSTTLTVAWR